MRAYQPDRSLKGKLRRRLVRLAHRRPLARAPDGPMITFSFDDAPVTAALAGAKLLEARGLHGVYFAAAGLADDEGPMGRYAGAGAYRRLSAAGHEIACHTFSHLDCGKAGGALALEDVDRNAAEFAAWGLPEPTTFAYPYGDVAAGPKRALARRFSVLRALHHGLIRQGSDLNQAPAVGIEGPNGPEVARRWMRRAVEEQAWLVLYTHDVAERPSAWGCTPDALARLIDDAVGYGMQVTTLAEGAARLGAGSR
jgi:peptidoglycan/xylan/chitin deacetylase (PgdA/CDA1 family)